MLGALAAFVFIINQDSMTDAKTYEARVGEGRSYISILCGADTKGRVAVEFQTTQELAYFSDDRASVEWRFDEDGAQQRWANWFGDRATLVGRDAEAFVARARDAVRIRARIRTANADYVEFDARAVINRGAIDRVIESCAAQ